MLQNTQRDAAHVEYNVFLFFSWIGIVGMDLSVFPEVFTEPFLKVHPALAFHCVAAE